MHSDADLPPDHRDPDWPDDWLVPASPEPSARRRARRVAALTLTAVVALGAGAGAVYIYQDGQPGSTPGASRSGPGPSGGGTVRAMVLLGPVRAVARDTVTVGGAPAPEVSAQVTIATRFTGSARSLAQVHVGDTVAVQISESNGVATVVSLQDPASA